MSLCSFWITVLPILLHGSSQGSKGLAHALVLSLEVGLELLGLVGTCLQHVLHCAIHTVGKSGEDTDLVFSEVTLMSKEGTKNWKHQFNLQVGLVKWPVRSLDGHEEGSSDQRILLSLSLSRFPPLLVGAGQEMLPHFRLRQDWVTTHAVHKALKLVHSVFNELSFVTTWKDRGDEFQINWLASDIACN